MATRRRKIVHLSRSPEVRGGRSPEEDAPSLPYEDLGDLEKEAIEEAVREAWRRLPAEARRQGIDLTTVGEEPITRLLRDELDKLRRDETEPVPGFSEWAFQHIPESEGAPDCTGGPSSKNTKYPDLVFRPVKIPRSVVRTSAYGLFVECKIIHRSGDHHGVDDYCKTGLYRFVIGDYAYVMPSGMMIAYVRNGKDVPSCLFPHLDNDANKVSYQVRSLPILRKGKPLRQPPVYVSRHGRSQVRVGQRSPGDIEIAHLWLAVA